MASDGVNVLTSIVVYRLLQLFPTRRKSPGTSFHTATPLEVYRLPV